MSLLLSSLALAPDYLCIVLPSLLRLAMAWASPPTTAANNVATRWANARRGYHPVIAVAHSQGAFAEGAPAPAITMLAHWGPRRSSIGSHHSAERNPIPFCL